MSNNLLYVVEWTCWEDGDFGYPKKDGFSLHTSEAVRDAFVKQRLEIPGTSANNISPIKNSGLYHQAKSNGGNLQTEHKVW
ncbi:hypothetical protein [Paraferrimonas sp. SM1919]|uniref:hypothetical protein n=1 Tax=Paraferrimonas sp. SM1919 TaxID=2662263 RepID=UPI0013D4A1B7|nr:hypothetical protein [Paraferrimonas sp. SM1919]